MVATSESPTSFPEQIIPWNGYTHGAKVPMYRTFKDSSDKTLLSPAPNPSPHILLYYPPFLLPDNGVQLALSQASSNDLSPLKTRQTFFFFQNLSLKKSI